MREIDLAIDAIDYVKLESITPEGMMPEEFFGIFLDAWVGLTFNGGLSSVTDISRLVTNSQKNLPSRVGLTYEGKVA